MSELSAEAAARLEAARDRYRNSLNDKHDALIVLRETFDSPDYEQMMDLRHQAHKIAGSAGLYGFESLRQSAATLDDTLRQTNPDAARIRSLLDNLIQELDALRQQ